MTITAAPAAAAPISWCDFQKSVDVSTSSLPSQNLKFEREDWTLFRTIEGLQQKAGVPKDRLRRLVLKELTDNALDAGADGVRVGELPDDDGYVITDNLPAKARP